MYQLASRAIDMAREFLLTKYFVRLCINHSCGSDGKPGTNWSVFLHCVTVRRRSFGTPAVGVSIKLKEELFSFLSDCSGIRAATSAQCKFGSEPRTGVASLTVIRSIE